MTIDKSWKTTYKLVRWNTPEELVRVLTECDEQGYRETLSRVYHDDGEKGWTIFTKTEEVTPSMLDAKVRLGDIWDITNRHGFIPNSYDRVPSVNAIVNDIKELYYKYYPETRNKEIKQ